MTSPDAVSEQTGKLPLWLRARRFLGRIRRRFRIDVFDVFKRPTSGAEERDLPAGYELRWGDAADIEGCDPFHTDLDEAARRFGIRRLEVGHRVVVAFHESLPVFSMWVNPRNLNVPGLVKRRLAAHQWFIYKAYTSPEHRGRKLYEAGMQFVLARMAEQGLTELVGYAHVKKAISRKGLARLGFALAGRMVSVDVPGWKHVFHSKRLQAEFPETARTTGFAKPEELAPEP